MVTSQYSGIGNCVAAVYPGAPVAPPRTLWQILEATAEAFPRSAAIDDGRSVLSYLDLLREVRRAGSQLAAAGIGAGDRVGVRVSSGSVELYVSVLAVLSVGAAYVPVDVDDPGERVELVWSASRVCAVVGDAGELTWREVRPSERTLVTIGGHCTLNAGSVIQCHSMEDGIFKSDRTVLEDGCTLGTGALVHYGVTMSQGSQLQPDSFLMKGESVPSRARWGGNPARAM
jgi:AMP-binding enzyme